MRSMACAMRALCAPTACATCASCRFISATISPVVHKSISRVASLTLSVDSPARYVSILRLSSRPMLIAAMQSVSHSLPSVNSISEKYFPYMK